MKLATNCSRSSDENRDLRFIGALQMVFIVLKLAGMIGWSWWLVLSPAWFVIALLLALVGDSVFSGLRDKIGTRRSWSLPESLRRDARTLGDPNPKLSEVATRLLAYADQVERTEGLMVQIRRWNWAVMFMVAANMAITMFY